MADRETAKRRFTLGDAMILVAATAIGLAAWRAALPELGSRNDPTNGVIAFLLAMWSWTALLLRLRRPRPALRRLIGRPGDAGCAAAAIATVASALAYVLRLAAHVFFAKAVIDIEDAIIIVEIAAAPAVLASWLTLALGRRWRREADWIGWLGRALGLGWLADFVLLILSV